LNGLKPERRQPPACFCCYPLAAGERLSRYYALISLILFINQPHFLNGLQKLRSVNIQILQNGNQINIFLLRLLIVPIFRHNHHIPIVPVLYGGKILQRVRTAKADNPASVLELNQGRFPSSRRQAIPNCFLKHRAKYFASVNPLANAACSRLLPPPYSIRSARCIRYPMR
jgi:hypothetical protein